MYTVNHYALRTLLDPSFHKIIIVIYPGLELSVGHNNGTKGQRSFTVYAATAHVFPE